MEIVSLEFVSQIRLSSSPFVAEVGRNAKLKQEISVRERESLIKKMWMLV